MFCTVVLAHRGSTLLVDRIDVLHQSVIEMRVARPFRVHAWAVLPDHMHFVWTLPEGDSDLSTRIGAMKARFTMKLRRAGFSPPSALPVVQYGRYAGLKPGLRRAKREVGIWQRRFWERHPRNEEELLACVDNCHFNPVIYWFVESPEDWPFSTLAQEAQVKKKATRRPPLNLTA